MLRRSSTIQLWHKACSSLHVTDRSDSLEDPEDNDGPGVHAGGLRDQNHRHALKYGTADDYPVARVPAGKDILSWSISE